jgi:phospholipase/carboxylesterase
VPTRIDAELREFRDWIFRFRPAIASPSRLILLLHGWTGDENSMWVFARNLPGNFEVLAPRGPFAAPNGGYSWREIQTGISGLPDFDDFRSTTEALLGFVDDWSTSEGRIMDQFDLIGFSQGAALSYAIVLRHPERIRAVAALSGFLPKGIEDVLSKRVLAGKPVFVSHGRQDNMVPVDQARKAVALLEESGARVTYCESDAGHKVGAECFSGLAEFLG